MTGDKGAAYLLSLVISGVTNVNVFEQWEC